MSEQIVDEESMVGLEASDQQQAEAITNAQPAGGCA